MRLRRIALAVVLVTRSASGQEKIDEGMNARIKTEGFQNSRVLETAVALSDLYGPRLAGSPGYREAAEWARQRLTSFGASSAVLEPWGTRGRGWVVERAVVEMIRPRYTLLNAVPKAWSPSTSGAVSGAPMLIEVRSPNDLEKYRGKLRGKILLNGRASAPSNRFDPPARRLTQTELDSLAALTDPGEPRTYAEDADGFVEGLARRNRIATFFREEGALAVLEPSGAQPGIVRVSSYSAYGTDPTGFIPAFIVGREHYDRIVRLTEANRDVTLQIDLRTQYLTNDSLGYNVVAEIAGTDPRLKDEVVMIGGHFDSWNAATGATDNAAGCAVAMEVLRILNAIGAKPRRTIRVALWDGEEHEDYWGSMGYVKRHFGDYKTMALKPEHAKLSAYFNVDHGTGKIRGIQLQSNEAARPIFTALLEPFRYLGAANVTIKNYGSTDHMPFAAVGLPGFNMLQDPIDYDSRTHHTSLDVASYLLEDDLKQAAVVMASLVYHVAMRDEKIPRVPLSRGK
jgi:carboxypeptidase Q